MLQRVMEIPGAVSVSLADGASGLLIAAAGAHPTVDGHADAALTTDILRSISSCPALSGPAPDDPTEIIVCRPGAYHLIHPIDGDYAARLFLHAVFDERIGNLGLSRHRIRQLVAETMPASSGPSGTTTSPTEANPHARHARPD
ncbi:hypothetical protein [Nocardia sp. NPDC005978]|uniref:hypothetical protein n=1 Tax=unclassified Nocardia TaxID=2637762 RepID=UPI0033A651F3